LIGTYRISDVVMGIMANPFYVDMGFSKDEVAAVTKIYGVIMTLVGAFVGGAMALRLGVMRVLMLGAVLECRQQSAVCRPEYAGSRPHGADFCDLGRQSGRRHGHPPPLLPICPASPMSIIRRPSTPCSVP
jgi:hypothetical protein